jgi:hypothetical protein
MKKKILISVSFVLALVILFALLQALVSPKYISNAEGLLTGGYYEDAGDHDVILVGDCEVYESFVPSVMWDEYGVTSYVRGGAQQLAWHSYYLLEETLRYETPKVVVFNVYALKYGTPQSEAYNRMTFDTMKWSGTKARGVLASMRAEENFIDYVFPILRYHSRITQLEKEDLKYILKAPKDESDNGYLIKTGVLPMKPSDPITAPPPELLPDTSVEYLDKIRALCEENGVELVLIKAPTNSRGYWWYDEWEEQIVEYSRENGVDYYNFISYADEMGIDWQTDTYDGGLHLNVYGAEKFTKYFGRILAEEYGLESRKSDSSVAERWENYLEEYKMRKKQMEDNEE